MRVWFVLLFSATVSGCSKELSRNDAADAIRTHLLTLAPDVLRSDSARLGVSIAEILKPSEGIREARLRTVFVVGRDSMTAVSWDSTMQMSAEFHRSDRGWALRRYGQQMKRLVGFIVAVRWEGELNYLSEPLYRLQSAYDTLNWPRRMEGIHALGRSDFGSYRRLTSGVPPADLAEYVTTHGLQPPDSIEWGYIPANGPNEKGAIWVRRRATMRPVCAISVGLNGEPPSDYWWVGDLGALSCATPRLQFVVTGIGDSIAEIISRQDGVLSPDQARLQ